jgi:hypothetical protein
MARQKSRSIRAAARRARTIRFPEPLRERISADADRCGRSFEAHVIALLRRHYGEDVDIAPSPDTILSLILGSTAGLSDAERATIGARLAEPDAE